MAARSGRVLLAIDGEPHTGNAIRWVLHMAEPMAFQVVAVHVVDPYLKQFVNEIYAQGRQEYLDHVDACLAEKAEQALADFESAARERGVSAAVETRRGDPLEELVAEAKQGRYDLLVLGRKNTSGLARWRSGYLPAKIADHLPELPLLIVPGQKTG